MTKQLLLDQSDATKQLLTALGLDGDITRINLLIEPQSVVKLQVERILSKDDVNYITQWALYHDVEKVQLLDPIQKSSDAA